MVPSSFLEAGGLTADKEAGDASGTADAWPEAGSSSGFCEVAASADAEGGAAVLPGGCSAEGGAEAGTANGWPLAAAEGEACTPAEAATAEPPSWAEYAAGDGAPVAGGPPDGAADAVCWRTAGAADAAAMDAGSAAERASPKLPASPAAPALPPQPAAKAAASTIAITAPIGLISLPIPAIPSLFYSCARHCPAVYQLPLAIFQGLSFRRGLPQKYSESASELLFTFGGLLTLGTAAAGWPGTYSWPEPASPARPAPRHRPAADLPPVQLPRRTAGCRCSRTPHP